jgi:mono/diheme cytochrome c family protein
MARARPFAVALVCLGLLVSAGAASPQSQPSPQLRAAISRAAVAPVNAVLKREAGALCADFAPSVAEKLVRASAAGVSCEAAATGVFAATASGDPGVTVLEYAKPAVKRLTVAGTRATITFTAEYTISTPGVRITTVRFELFGPQRVQLEEQAGVWRVSSAGTLAAVCLHSGCAAGASQLLFSYGEPQMLATTLVPVPAAVRRAGGAEERQFKEGGKVAAQSGCLACHKIGEHGNRGPGQNLTHVGASLSEREIEHAIEDPRAPMPSFRHLPAAKLRALVRFLSLLR